jgi:crotonobetainyl-CoA:carnitine CoA-transferase CaiB-like acyl-CoA transferase
MLQHGWMMPYRVLDLCDEKGCFCGKVLGDLGCDVIQVMKPVDDPSRHASRKAPDQQENLFWLAYNANKRFQKARSKG